MDKFSVTFESGRHFLSARVVGLPLDLSAAYDGFSDVATRSHEVHQKRLLIECGGADRVAADGGITFLAAMNEYLRMSHGIKAAIVTCSDSCIDASASSIASLTRTGADVGYFTDRTAAETWLIAGTISPWPPRPK